MIYNVLTVSADETVRRELRQGRPFRSEAQAVIVGLLLTADRVKRRIAALVEPHGITVQQFNVLRILRGAGSQGMPTLEVAGRMVEQTPGITRLLDRLESKQLVRRQQCPKDRRQHLCWITTKGEQLLEKLEDPLQEVAEKTLKGIAAGRRTELLGLLNAVRASPG